MSDEADIEFQPCILALTLLNDIFDISLARPLLEGS